jgi:hypothetical protein
MAFITLTEEQARVVISSPQPVEIRDPAGNVLAVIEPIWLPDDIDEAKRRLASGEPSLTTAQLLAALRAKYPV